MELNNINSNGVSMSADTNIYYMLTNLFLLDFYVQINNFHMKTNYTRPY